MLIIFSILFVLIFTSFAYGNKERKMISDTYELDIDNVVAGEYLRSYKNDKGSYYPASSENYNGEVYLSGVDSFEICYSSRGSLNQKIYIS